MLADLRNQGKAVILSTHQMNQVEEMCDRVLMIDHGLGVSSIFIHLDSVTVTEGDLVRQGEIVARVGQTGRATGPHLHWGVSVGSTAIDPLRLIGVDLLAISATKSVSAAKRTEDSAGRTFTVSEFVEMTYLTELGVGQWLKQGRLTGQQNEKGDWLIDAANLQVPDISRLLREAKVP